MKLRTAFVSIGGLAALAVFSGRPLCFAQSAAGTINTVAGDGSMGFAGDGGPATSARLSSPDGLAFDKMGNMFIVDNGNNRIRKVDSSGVITTVAGTGKTGFSGDGGAATNATFSWGFNGHLGIAVDGSGNLYIPDLSNERVRRVDTNGIITTVAGTGVRENSGDGGPATSAGIVDPIAVAVDSGGNLYIAEFAGNRVRKVSTSGIITTAAGGGPLGPTNGDGGPATKAVLNAPFAVAFDGAGNLYIGDVTARLVRKVDTSGIITTVAGNGSTTDSGDGGPATKAGFSLTGLAADGAGDIFISESTNRVREVNTSGTINTIAGTGAGGHSGDGGPAISATLNSPGDVAVDGAGNLYIADFFNNRVREVAGIAQATSPVTAVNAASFASAPVATGSIVAAFGSDLANQTASASGALSTTLGGTTAMVTDSSGATAAAQLFYVSPTQVNLLIPSSLAAGQGQLQIVSGDGTVSESAMQIAAVSPGLFADGQLALGDFIQVNAQGQQTAQNLVQVSSAGQVEATPINLAASADPTYLVLYGTGLHNALLSQVSVVIGGVTVAPAYAGMQGTFVGLDQVNVAIPNSLAGAGSVAVTVTANGVSSNTVHVTIE
jgi:uncharacterized protein (TIGR03437 family)